MKKSILSLMAASLTMICCKTQQKAMVADKPEEKKTYDISHHIDERGNFKYTGQNIYPFPMPDSIFAMGGQQGNKVLINDRALTKLGAHFTAKYEFKEAEELVRKRVSEENYNPEHLFVVKINNENKTEILKHENPEDHQAIFEHHSAIGQAKRARDIQNILNFSPKSN